MRFASPQVGTTAVVAAVTKPGGLVRSGSVSTTWTPAPTGTLSVSPAHATAAVGAQQQIVATVSIPSGGRVDDGTVVSFTVAGPGAGTTAGQVSTRSGTAIFGFTSSSAGTSTLTVQTGELQGTATRSRTSATQERR